MTAVPEQTPAIRLIPVDPGIEAALASSEEARRRLGADPGEHLELARKVVTQTRRHEARIGAIPPWSGYLAVDAGTAAIVGCGGFKGNPTAEGTVEIAYMTFPAFEGRGVATRIAGGLVEIARASPAVRAVIAHTLAEPNASTRVLRKCGFGFAGDVVDPEDGPVWRWTLDLAPRYFLTTERLGFRTWSRDDLELARGLWGDPEVTRMIGGPFADEEVSRRLENEIATQESAGVQYWPCFLLRTGEHAGCCGLRPHDEDGVLELGFHLRRAQWGRGLATEAVLAVVRYAFDRLGVRGLFAGHHPDNALSRRVLEKAGFRYSHHEFHAPTGLEHPSYRLSAPPPSIAGR